MANRGGSITIVNHPDVLSEPFVVLMKPAGLPSGPGTKCEANCVAFCDNSTPCIAPCALGRAMERYPSIRTITAAPGRFDYGLVHRLDTAVSGLLLVALTQSAYDGLLAEQRACRFVKEYRALCSIENKKAARTGFPPCPVQWERHSDGQCCTIESRFRPWGNRGQAVRPVTEESGPAAQKKAAPRTYRTEIRLGPPKDGKVEAFCRITEGFRHQVRCHLAWLGLPVLGDELYGGELPQNALPLTPVEVLPKTTGMHFFATGLAFRLDKDYSFRI